MKTRCCLMILCTVYSYSAVSQGEFELHASGLLYSETAMGLLLEQSARAETEYLACRNEAAYLAEPQATARLMVLKAPKETVAAIDEALAARMAPDTFKHRFEAYLEEYSPEVPVGRYEDEWDGDSSDNFYIPGYDYRMSLESGDPGFGQPGLQGRWQVWTRRESGDKVTMVVVYYNSPFRSPALPVAYAQMASYAACMINPNEQIFVEGIRGGGDPEVARTALDAFMALVEAPLPDDFDSEGHKEWIEKCREMSEEAEMRDDYLPKLEAAVKGAITLGTSNARLEEHASRHLDTELVLELLRRRQLVGGCSQDQGPRLQARAIAHMAAELGRWDIFLRAHMNLTNDNFSRVSDGSYAWGRRMTYITELEALHIDLPRFLLGSSISLDEEAHPGHYLNSPRRIGRAMASMNDRQPLETLLITMISDSELDNLNRVRLLAVYSHYLYNLPKDEGLYKGFELVEQLATETPFLAKLSRQWIPHQKQENDS